MAMLLALVLSVLWKAHPDISSCALFWLTVVWMTHSTKLVFRPAGLIILLGVVSNAVVTVFNGGVMPVVGMPHSFSPLFPVWHQAQANSGFLFLADHACLHYFSIGDFFLLAGASMLAITKVHEKFRRAVPQYS